MTAIPNRIRTDGVSEDTLCASDALAAAVCMIWESKSARTRFVNAFPKDLRKKIAGAMLSALRTVRAGKPIVLHTCPSCGQGFGARAIRKHTPECIKAARQKQPRHKNTKLS
jgi:hypothetical protein